MLKLWFNWQPYNDWGKAKVGAFWGQHQHTRGAGRMPRCCFFTGHAGRLKSFRQGAIFFKTPLLSLWLKRITISLDRDAKKTLKDQQAWRRLHNLIVTGYITDTASHLNLLSSGTCFWYSRVWFLFYSANVIKFFGWYNLVQQISLLFIVLNKVSQRQVWRCVSMNAGLSTSNPGVIIRGNDLLFLLTPSVVRCGINRYDAALLLWGRSKPTQSCSRTLEMYERITHIIRIQ